MNNTLLSLLLLVVIASPAAAKEPAVIVAHRGESHLAPENTLAAVKLAWELGSAIAEIDCHLTADGRLAVIHDADTRRTGDRNLVVRNATFDELQQVDVGRWKGDKWAGERIPSLEQVLATIPPGRRLLIEIKVGPEAVPALRRAIELSGKPASQLVVISFNAATVAEVKKTMPGQEAWWISGLRQDKETGAWSPTLDQLLATARDCRADGLCIQARPPVDQAFVDRVRSAGLHLNVWTINSPAEARRYIDFGVDSVTTDRAAWMREQLGR
jgi:glycerophosphoryl diester phosphodiesterase